MALIANCNRDPERQSAFGPADFDPFAILEKSCRPRAKASIGVLKTVFIEGRLPEGIGDP